MIYNHRTGNKDSNRFNRSRSLTVASFQPQTREEYLIHEIAKALEETSVAYLKSILDRYGYYVIKDAWNELRTIMNSGREIRSRKRLLNYLIQQRIERGGRQ